MNCHRVLLNMSADKLHFLPKRCDYLKVSTVILTVKNVPKVNLFSGH